MGNLGKALGSRTCALVLLGVALISFATFICAGGWVGGEERYGPFVCNNSCSVGTPVADAKTLAFLREMDAQQNIVIDTRVVGDQYVICNGAACVVYTRTHSGGFEGGKAIPQTESKPPTLPSGGGAGGGGSSTSDGAGNSGGSSGPDVPNVGPDDCWGNCTRYGRIGDWGVA